MASEATRDCDGCAGTGRDIEDQLCLNCKGKGRVPIYFDVRSGMWSHEKPDDHQEEDDGE